MRCLRHAVLLRSTLLSRQPLRPSGRVQFSIRLEIVEDFGVIQSTSLGLSALHFQQRMSTHTFTMTLPGNVAPARHMVEPQSPLPSVSHTQCIYLEHRYQKLETISLPPSAFFLCCLGVPWVTLKPSSEKTELAEKAPPLILRQSTQWQRISVRSAYALPVNEQYIRWHRCRPAPRNGRYRKHMNRKAC